MDFGEIFFSEEALRYKLPIAQKDVKVLVKSALTHNHNIDGHFAIVQDIYVPTMGGITQIDLMMIHEKGIVVFDCEDYYDWINGDLEHLYWTQHFEVNRTARFCNPVRWNMMSIAALSEYLMIPVCLFTSCIVFSDLCAFKCVPPNSKELLIVRFSDMIHELRARFKTAPNIYSELQIRKMAMDLSQLADEFGDDEY